MTENPLKDEYVAAIDCEVLTKRSLSTTVNAADCELIVLGGLTQEKNSANSSGLSFLPKFMRSDAHYDSRTELLLLLQVDRVVR
ncbi:type II and III secretion system protein [Massilia sp. MB5]|uniref:type II and III secretion system protein n=1 Tax=Massilia sp. MB5 TaxID=2919578 RepID=UPI001F0CFDFE|nr:type II and III secretion system protein [Massilia sp. MB5]UMR31060.1 type II and III secretion system protein [Massilia sp. MB5]